MELKFETNLTDEELRHALGIKEAEKIRKRFENGNETLEDLLKNYISYHIKTKFKSKEIETDMIELKYYRKLINVIYNLQAELERKDKIIDKMAFKIVKLDNYSNEYCCGRKMTCPYKNPTLKKCKECIKIYYEKRNKNDYSKSE